MGQNSTQNSNISPVCQPLQTQNHNLCAYKFQVLYSTDHPPSFWQTILCSCTCTATFHKSLVSLRPWLCLKVGGCKNLQNVNKPYTNTMQSPTNKNPHQHQKPTFHKIKLILVVYNKFTDIRQHDKYLLEYLGYMFRPVNRSSSGHQYSESEVLFRYCI